MDLQSSKIELAKMILSIDNIKFIEKLKSFVKKERKDFWSELTLSEKNEIERGIRELDNGEKIAYNDFLKKIS